MIRKQQTIEEVNGALGNGHDDRSALTLLARRVIHAASLAVMVHGELDVRSDQGTQDKDA